MHGPVHWALNIQLRDSPLSLAALLSLTLGWLELTRRKPCPLFLQSGLYVLRPKNYTFNPRWAIVKCPSIDVTLKCTPTSYLDLTGFRWLFLVGVNTSVT